MQHVPNSLEIRLKDRSSATLQAVLMFCYTAECHLTPENVLPICALADHFEVKALHAACVQFIEHNISVSSCCTMLEMAAQYDMEALRKVCTAATLCAIRPDVRLLFTHAHLCALQSEANAVRNHTRDVLTARIPASGHIVQRQYLHVHAGVLGHGVGAL